MMSGSKKEHSKVHASTNGEHQFHLSIQHQNVERIPNEPGRDLNWREHHLMTAIKNRQEIFF